MHEKVWASSKKVLFVAALLAVAILSLVGSCSPSILSTTPSHTVRAADAIFEDPVKTTGCGKVAPFAPGTSATENITSAGRLRTFRVHLPRSYRDTVRQALVLNFHGHGSLAIHQETSTGLSILADQQDFIAVYPQGIIGPDKNTGWSTGTVRNPHVNDVLFTSDLLNHLQSTLCVDAQRIYATGFSNGGGMTNLLACDLSMRIAAFAPVSGAYPDMPGGCRPQRPVPLLEIHGTADSVVPYNGSVAKGYPPVQQWLGQWVQRDGCASRPVTTSIERNVVQERWTACKAGGALIHYRIIGEGHSWPTQLVLDKKTLRHSNDPYQFDADTVIWSFFQDHPLPAEQA